MKLHCLTKIFYHLCQFFVLFREEKKNYLWRAMFNRMFSWNIAQIDCRRMGRKNPINNMNNDDNP